MISVLSISMTVGLNILNAIVCADDLIVPIKIDKNSYGMQDLVEFYYEHAVIY